MIILYFIKDDKFAIVDKNIVMDILYEEIATVKPILNNKLYKYVNGKFELSTVETKINVNTIKKNISKINNKIPLYDIYSKQIYMIFKDNIYDYIIYHSYRFPDTQFYNKYIDEPKIINLLNNFDLKILEQTYVSTFYYYSNKVGKNLTLCIRPSFLPHLHYIKPYYTRSELINIGLNMGIIEPDNIYYDKNNNLMDLCKKVQKNDISSDIILKHQEYIVQSKGIHASIYYTFHGSYFMNKYLRSNNDIQNALIENNILILWKLIKHAPAFDKPYWLYRFVDNDEHINKLKINDIYTEKSFISTTRDPFYNNDKYQFGFILIKIKVRPNVPGSALCIETFSKFNLEEEIIFPPKTRLRLVAKDNNCKYYHIDSKFKQNIVTKYEFEFVDNLDIHIDVRTIIVPHIYVDFNKLLKQTYDYSNFDILVRNFIKTYVNKNYQFQTTINNILYTCIIEFYNSDSVYAPYYAIKNKNGLSIYIQNPKTMNTSLVLEIDVNAIHVNYYSKFSYNDAYFDLNTRESITFISSIAYIFGIDKIIIHPHYNSCSDFINSHTTKLNDQVTRILEMHNYRYDFYTYLTTKQQWFDEQLTITAGFFYYELDSLHYICPTKILSKDDKDTLYQIYINNSNITNITELYVFIVKNHSDKITILESKINKIFKTNNPFIHDYYILKPLEYLFNNKLIFSIPKITMKDDIVITSYNKSSYRLELERRYND